MRTISIFIIAILACSCRPADSNLKSYDNIEKRYEEVSNIWRDYQIKEMEREDPNSKIIIIRDSSKNDYETYKKEYPNTNIRILTEGNIELRGPLTKEQVEQELIAGSKNPSIKLNIPLLNKYQKGDEFYYFISVIPLAGGSKGYILIRDNKYIGEYETQTWISKDYPGTDILIT